MEYERIHKVQTGVLSPSKLRMKILRAQKSIRKGRSNSSRASPAKTEDMEYAKNCLLVGDPDEGTSKDTHHVLRPADGNAESSHRNQNTYKNFSHQLHYQNLSMIHPLRNLDEVSNLHDSAIGNFSTSSFEFHHMERTPHSIFSLVSRHVPSKWNDAEKWILNRQSMNSNAMKKAHEENQGDRQIVTMSERVGPELVVTERKLHVQPVDRKRNDLSRPPSETMVEKFSFVSHNSNYNSVGSCNFPYLGDSGSSPSTMMEINHQESLVAEGSASEASARHGESVSMRDIGTEMTPIPSPLGSITPTRSPIASIPSTPRGILAPSSAEATIHELYTQSGEELSEKELQLRTRREIAALGIQLGKMNIATWASKEEAVHPSISTKILDVNPEKMEYEARATAWEEAENSKHQARYEREEVKIEAWESHQKAKIEAEMKNIEAKVVQMRAHAMEKMSEKLVMIQQEVEEKEAAAHARMNKQAARIAYKADRVRRTGKFPSSNFLCCIRFF